MNGLFNQTPHLKSFQYENSLLKSTKLHLATFSNYPEANSKPEVKCQCDDSPKNSQNAISNTEGSSGRTARHLIRKVKMRDKTSTSKTYTPPSITLIIRIKTNSPCDFLIAQRCPLKRIHQFLDPHDRSPNT